VRGGEDEDFSPSGQFKSSKTQAAMAGDNPNPFAGMPNTGGSHTPPPTHLPPRDRTRSNSVAQDAASARAASAKSYAKRFPSAAAIPTLAYEGRTDRKQNAKTFLACDAKSQEGFYSRFPAARRLKTI
jgi:hypothetical protein